MVNDVAVVVKVNRPVASCPTVTFVLRLAAAIEELTAVCNLATKLSSKRFDFVAFADKNTSKNDWPPSVLSENRTSLRSCPVELCRANAVSVAPAPGIGCGLLIVEMQRAAGIKTQA